MLHIYSCYINGDEMLKTYHREAYGSKKPDEWGCHLGYCGQNQEGCFSLSDDSMMHPRQQIRKSSYPDELSKQAIHSTEKLRFRLIWHRINDM